MEGVHDFLSDVRAEMRKVVAPSRKEVESTTIVVIIAVFIFGLYFFVVDSIFQYGLHGCWASWAGFSVTARTRNESIKMAEELEQTAAQTG